MSAISHGLFPKEEWRPGVDSRMRVSALNGADSLCIFEQWCLPDRGAPLHWHNVEEVLSVIDGIMEVQLGEMIHVLNSDESVVVPSRVIHGFRNVGSGVLHVHAILAASHFEAWRSVGTEPTVRWKISKNT